MLIWVISASLSFESVVGKGSSPRDTQHPGHHHSLPFPGIYLHLWFNPQGRMNHWVRCAPSDATPTRTKSRGIKVSAADRYTNKHFVNYKKQQMQTCSSIYPNLLDICKYEVVVTETLQLCVSCTLFFIHLVSPHIPQFTDGIPLKAIPSIWLSRPF